MQYKTIILELLEQFPNRHEQLRRERRLLEAVESLAAELKVRHEAWTTMLATVEAKIDPSQLSSAALETALGELHRRLQHEFHDDQSSSDTDLNTRPAPD